MGVAKTRAGFTLIEVTVVLAISSLLTLILFTGYHDQQGRARFRDAVENLTSRLESTRTEANSTLNLRTGAGTDTAHIVFGRYVEFANGGDYTVGTLSAANNESGQLTGIADGGSDSGTIAWGVKVSGLTRPIAVVFARSPQDGKLNTYIIDITNTGGSNPLYQADSYSVSTDPTSNDLRSIPLALSDGTHQATLTINADSGETTVHYLN